MRSVLAYPGNMAQAQNVALALLESNQLSAFVTSFTWNPNGRLARLLTALPGELPEHISRHLGRRSVGAVPPDFVHSYPFWEFVRTFCQKGFRNEVLTDLAWDRLSHSFDTMVARRYVPHTQVIQCYEYTALAAFRRAKELGVARVLHIPSLDSRCFLEIQRRERDHWPGLAGEFDGYYDAKFEQRYARRCAEIELADVIIANSMLTAQSHINAGADPAKVFPVLLGAPPVVCSTNLRPRSTGAPLQVVWAGSFSLRKGAHYMLSAWRKLDAGPSAQLHVFGRQALPTEFRASDESGIKFHGSVPQRRVFAAFLEADVLVFPTLSDGFGMVVVEAFAHGLPVITTSDAGAADLVTADNGLIVPAADDEALADALHWCLDNRLKLQEMRLAALETAKARQWSDFRHDFLAARQTGLDRKGYQMTSRVAV